MPEIIRLKHSTSFGLVKVTLIDSEIAARLCNGHMLCVSIADTYGDIYSCTLTHNDLLQQNDALYWEHNIADAIRRIPTVKRGVGTMTLSFGTKLDIILQLERDNLNHEIARLKRNQTSIVDEIAAVSWHTIRTEIISVATLAILIYVIWIRKT